MATVLALLACAQAVLAGGFLAGYYESLGLHRDNGRITGFAAVALLVAAVVLRRPGGGPGWPVPVCAVLAAGFAGQIVLGFARILSLHVPLGVAVVGGSVAVAAWAWHPAGGNTPGDPR